MPKRAYNISFKLKAITLAGNSGNRPAASQLGVDEKRIREWKQQFDQGKFQNLITGHGEGIALKRQRLSGGGCKPAFVDIEEELSS